MHPGESEREPTGTVNLVGQSVADLRTYLQTLGEPAYRGAQIYHALYVERRSDIAAMTNLPVALRERLGREASIALPRIVRRYQSSDGTLRYVLALLMRLEQSPPQSKQFSCPKRIARRFAFRRRRAAR